MNTDDLKSLIDKYLQGKTNPEEERLLNEWYDSFQHIPRNWNERELGNKADTGQKMWDKISTDLAGSKDHPRVIKFPGLFIAATVTILLCFSLYLLFNNKQEAPLLKSGAGQALLTLADGTRLNLKDAENTVIAEQPGGIISKNDEGELVYTEKPPTKPGRAVFYNTIQTARSSQYKVTLSDGTAIWLNAESSISYPTQFNEGERIVRLTGQAYFEVAPDKQKPFKVITEKQQVVVLGTHFDIKAYPGEKAVKTSLVEGSVKIITEQLKYTAILKPGQQSVADNGKLEVQDFDTTEGIGWKEGYFVFNNEGMESAMGQLARWYDVEVSYIGDPDPIVFGGSFSKSDKLEDILKILESTNKFKCKQEGRRITIII